MAPTKEERTSPINNSSIEHRHRKKEKNQRPYRRETEGKLETTAKNGQRQRLAEKNCVVCSSVDDVG
jgi:hypothetical protein